MVQCMIFGRLEELAELADGPTGRGEVTRVGCLLARYIRVTRSAMFTVAERSRTDAVAALVTLSQFTF